MSAEIVNLPVRGPRLSMASRVRQALIIVEHGLAQLPKSRGRSVPEKNARADFELAAAELRRAMEEWTD